MTPIDEAPAMNPTDDGLAFITAVRDLRDADRVETTADLHLAACCSALRTGPRKVAEIRRRVGQIWPGVDTSQKEIESALALGREIGHVTSRTGIDGSELFELTATGIEDVDLHAKWTNEMVARTREDIKSKATEGLGIEIDDSTADLWMHHLVGVLVAGISKSQKAHLGDLQRPGKRLLRPKGLDRSSFLAEFDSLNAAEETTEFIKALAFDAIDPLDAFGNELVSNITIGCVLHAIVAGRDSTATLKRLGAPSGQRAVIDTPVLIDLVGPDRVKVRAMATIRAAIDSGWEVIVCEHSVEEFNAVIDREIPEIASRLRDALRAGVAADLYATLDEDQLPGYCVEALREKTYKTLDEMRAAAGQVPAKLAELGVEVRPHGNEKDQGQVDSFREALQKDIGNGFRQRSARVLQRDADSMTVAWRRRKREKTTKWPGAWIVTTDRHIAPAYAEVDKRDKVPVTLTMSQWSAMQSITAAPTDVLALAEAAASHFVDETMLNLPTRYPTEVAYELARKLGPDAGGSRTDVRVAQFTFDELEDHGDHGAFATRVASSVQSKRHIRVEAVQAQRMAAMQEERDRAVSLARAAEADASQAKLRARQAESRGDALEREVGGTKSVRRRLIYASVLSTAMAPLTVAAWFTAPTGVALVATAFAISSAAAGYRWAYSGKPFWPSLFGTFSAVAGAIAAVIAILAMAD